MRRGSTAPVGIGRRDSTPGTSRSLPATHLAECSGRRRPTPSLKCEEPSRNVEKALNVRIDDNFLRSGRPDSNRRRPAWEGGRSTGSDIALPRYSSGGRADNPNAERAIRFEKRIRWTRGGPFVDYGGLRWTREWPDPLAAHSGATTAVPGGRRAAGARPARSSGMVATTPDD